jgi:hypothetical protein
MKRLILAVVALVFLTAASCTVRVHAEERHGQPNVRTSEMRHGSGHRDFDSRRHIVDRDNRVFRFHRERGIYIEAPIFLYPYDGRTWYCTSPYGDYPVVRECNVEWVLRF